MAIVIQDPQVGAGAGEGALDCVRQEIGFKAAGMLRISGGFWNCPWEVRKVPGFQQLRVVTRSPGAFAPHPLAPMATLLAGEGSSGLVPWFLTSFGRR